MTKAKKEPEEKSKGKKKLFPRILPSLLGTGLGVYYGVIRPKILTWGATSEEVDGKLPGDEIVVKPRYVTTRAFEMKATPAEIWPWLVQMGQGRGGFYSYDKLENLFGCEIYNADKILPEYQNLKLGDKICLAPPKDFDPAMLVTQLEPEKHLVLSTPGETAVSPVANLPFASWAFVLHQKDENTTRLIIRFRSDFKPTIMGYLVNRIMLEPIQFIMERKMLLGIKVRAEMNHVAPHLATPVLSPASKKASQKAKIS
ncbi:MAG TPA: hypothetical protein VH186_28825 [Chloroflexia bacterium]|nr:hypothetical protein [Chloroflexia bacterium]